jgi:hypothetical protein
MSHTQRGIPKLAREELDTVCHELLLSVVNDGRGDRRDTLLVRGAQSLRERAVAGNAHLASRKVK